jgi:hypothetical protein
MADLNSLGPLGTLAWGFISSDDTDHPEDRSGSSRITPLDIGDPGESSNYPFSPTITGSTQASQQTFGGCPTPGTPCLYIKPMGSPHGIIIGHLNSMFTGQDGGSGLLGNNKLWKQKKDTKLNIRTPPRVKETTDADGVRIRKIEESGEMHSLGLLEGLPLNGALFEMVGFRQPELPKIPTAKQSNDGMMTLDQMQQMIGQIMSLGQMFAGLAGNRGGGGGGGGFPNGFASGNPSGNIYVYDSNTVNSTIQTDTANNFIYGGSQYYSANNRLVSIQNRVPSDISMAIGNLAKLIQGLEVNDGVSFFTGGLVHEDTYLQNAENLLCECKSLDDLMNVLSRLQYDEELHGTDKLQDVYVTIETSYGPTDSVIDWTGNIYVQYSSSVMEEMNTFSETFTSNTSSPAVGSIAYDYTPPPSGTPTSTVPGDQGGGNSGGFDVAGIMGMFSGSAQTMQELMKRLHPEGEKTARKLYKKVNDGEKSKKLFDINKKTLNNGNPFEGGDYSKSLTTSLEYLE